MNLSGDDRLNLLILIATLAFMAWAIPNRLAENADAEIGRAARMVR